MIWVYIGKIFSICFSTLTVLINIYFDKIDKSKRRSKGWYKASIWFIAVPALIAVGLEIYDKIQKEEEVNQKEKERKTQDERYEQNIIKLNSITGRLGSIITDNQRKSRIDEQRYANNLTNLVQINNDLNGVIFKIKNQSIIANKHQKETIDSLSFVATNLIKMASDVVDTKSSINAFAYPLSDVTVECEFVFKPDYQMIKQTFTKYKENCKCAFFENIEPRKPPILSGDYFHLEKIRSYCNLSPSQVEYIISNEFNDWSVISRFPTIPFIENFNLNIDIHFDENNATKGQKQDVGYRNGYTTYIAQVKLVDSIIIEKVRFDSIYFDMNSQFYSMKNLVNSKLKIELSYFTANTTNITNPPHLAYMQINFNGKNKYSLALYSSDITKFRIEEATYEKPLPRRGQLDIKNLRNVFLYYEIDINEKIFHDQLKLEK